MIKVFEAFAGYGSQSMALRRLGIDFEVVGISEIDKYAIQAYMAVHGDTPNYGDISKIDWKEVPDFDFLTYSFPCTDISSAGLQKGLEEGSGTRSSLLWECKKAIEAKRPKYLLMKNVKALTFKKFKPYLEKWLDYLKDLGYTNFAKVLNAKNYGVPQNRERIFLISILGEAQYYFPEGFELSKRLKDVLGKDVYESFYLSKKAIDGFNRHKKRMKERGNGFGWEPTEGDCIASSVLTTAGCRPDDNFIKVKYGNKRVQSLVESGKISGDKVEFIDAYNQQVQDICGKIKTTIDSSCMSFIAEPITCDMREKKSDKPSDRNPGIDLEPKFKLGGDIVNNIITVQKDSLVSEPKLVIRQATKKGYIEIPQGGVFDASYPDSTTRRGRVQGDGFISPTLTAGGEPPCLFEGIAEPNVLTSKRTEYGKAMRKDYEAENIQESRHNMTQLEPRTDGVSNTITTVQKDNLLAEPKIIQVGNLAESKGFNNPQRGRVYNPNGICPNIDTKGGGNREPKIIESSDIVTGQFDGYRIRKLTPRECFRLMGVSESDIDKIQSAGISKTQQYKMAGNSIVVDVLYYIFKKMFVDKSCEEAQLSLF